MPPQDLPPMPPHALRHTAAAAWLADRPLAHLRGTELGHRSITTTDEYYGHLETTLFKGATALTEAMISAASHSFDSLAHDVDIGKHPGCNCVPFLLRVDLEPPAAANHADPVRARDPACRAAVQRPGPLLSGA